MGLPFHLLSPSVKAQEVCIAAGVGMPAGTKEKEVFSFGISTWFLQKLLTNTTTIIFYTWSCSVSFPFTESQHGRDFISGNKLLIWRGFVCFPLGSPSMCLTTLTERSLVSFLKGISGISLLPPTHPCVHWARSSCLHISAQRRISLLFVLLLGCYICSLVRHLPSSLPNRTW